MNRNKHNQNVGSNIERSDDRINSTSEVFTPMEVCVRMVQSIPENKLRDPKSTFLDDSAGSGNFLIALRDELVKYHDLDHVLNYMIYAVELMEDNHRELCNRLGVSVDHPHYVCHNALTYDYSFGEKVSMENYMQ